MVDTLDALKKQLASVAPGGLTKTTVGSNPQLTVSSQELAAALGVKPATTPIGYLYVNATNGLFIRATAGSNGTKLTAVGYGTKLGLLSDAYSVADGMQWAAVETPTGVRGFAARQYLQDTDPVAPAPTITLLPAKVRGVGASAGGWTPKATELELIRRNAVRTVLICAYQSGQAQSAIPAFRNAGVENFIVRAASNAIQLPAQWVNDTLPRVAEYHTAIAPTPSSPLLVAIHNEPNLYVEGLGKFWNSGREFAAWFEQVAKLYREKLANIRVGFPALSPGGDIGNVRKDADVFWKDAAPYVLSADWIGVHAYWTKPDGSDLILPSFNYKGLPVVATEVGPGDTTKNTPQAVLHAYQRFAAAGIPCIGWVLDGAGAWGNASWTVNNIVLEGL